MSTIKELIQSLAEGEEQIEPSEFDSLILDDQELNRDLTPEDKAYLEEFSNVQLLSFSNTKVSSLKNLPDLPDLKRIEINGNGLPGSALKELLKYKDSLHTVKFEGNHVATFEEVEALKGVMLGNLSLKGNPVADLEGYRDKMFEIFPELELLDGFDREGEEQESDEDVDSDYGEEGEAEEINEEMRKKLAEQGFDLAEDGEDDYGDDFDDEDAEDMLYDDEDGEEEDYDDEEEEEPAPKRQKK